MLLVALLIIAKSWKQSGYPSAHGWINCGTQTMKCYPVLKGYELQGVKEHEMHVPKGKTQSENVAQYMILWKRPNYRGSKKKNSDSGWGRKERKRQRKEGH